MFLQPARRCLCSLHNLACGLSLNLNSDFVIYFCSLLSPWNKLEPRRRGTERKLNHTATALCIFLSRQSLDNFFRFLCLKNCARIPLFLSSGEVEHAFIHLKSLCVWVCVRAYVSALFLVLPPFFRLHYFPVVGATT